MVVIVPRAESLQIYVQQTMHYKGPQASRSSSPEAPSQNNARAAMPMASEASPSRNSASAAIPTVPGAGNPPTGASRERDYVRRDSCGLESRCSESVDSRRHQGAQYRSGDEHREPPSSRRSITSTTSSRSSTIFQKNSRHLSSCRSIASAPPTTSRRSSAIYRKNGQHANEQNTYDCGITNDGISEAQDGFDIEGEMAACREQLLPRRQPNWAERLESLSQYGERGGSNTSSDMALQFGCDNASTADVSALTSVMSEDDGIELTTGMPDQSGMPFLFDRYRKGPVSGDNSVCSSLHCEAGSVASSIMTPTSVYEKATGQRVPGGCDSIRSVPHSLSGSKSSRAGAKRGSVTSVSTSGEKGGHTSATSAQGTNPGGERIRKRQGRRGKLDYREEVTRSSKLPQITEGPSFEQEEGFEAPSYRVSSGKTKSSTSQAIDYASRRKTFANKADVEKNKAEAKVPNVTKTGQKTHSPIEFWSTVAALAAESIMSAGGTELTAKRIAGLILGSAMEEVSEAALQNVATKASVAVLSSGGNKDSASAAAVAILNARTLDAFSACDKSKKSQEESSGQDEVCPKEKHSKKGKGAKKLKNFFKRKK